MYDDVLLPVGVGEVRESPAVERALSLAEQYDATRHPLSVVDQTGFDSVPPETGRIHESLEEGAEGAVDEAADIPALTVPL